jgi:hypothetical protein
MLARNLSSLVIETKAHGKSVDAMSDDVMLDDVILDDVMLDDVMLLVHHRPL